MVADSLFSDYLIDYSNFKNILLACDQFKRFIQILLKYTPKCILLPFETFSDLLRSLGVSELLSGGRNVGMKADVAGQKARSTMKM